MREKSSVTDVKVLETCRFWMNNLGLCIESDERQFGTKHQANVPVWLIQCLYSIPSCVSILLAIWHIIDKNFDFTASSVALIVIVGAGQCQIIYFLLIAKNNSLIKTVSELQTLVDKSKNWFWFNKIWKWFFMKQIWNCDTFFTGISRMWRISYFWPVLWRIGSEKLDFGQANVENVCFCRNVSLCSGGFITDTLCDFRCTWSTVLGPSARHKVIWGRFLLKLDFIQIFWHDF